VRLLQPARRRCPRRDRGHDAATQRCGGLQPRREFVERGGYRVLRHPVSLSFLGLIWFAPLVTLDRVVLMAVWTAYIVVGSVLKDRRLLHFIGNEYRGYRARVPGYPGIPFGPLARIR
jgi:protein-S-isoprenylcysteine O-methyltransferase Ste14